MLVELNPIFFIDNFESGLNAFIVETGKMYL